MARHEKELQHMNRLMLASAVLLAVAAAGPALAQSASNPPATTQAAAPPPAPPEGGIMHGPGMMGDRMMEHGMMGPGGWRHRMMAMQWARQSPQQRCINRMARHAGMIAYVVAKLNLTPQQRPLWSKVEAALNAAGERQQHLCNALPAADAWQQQTILDRLSRHQAFLSARLRDLQQVQPALQQFYQSLTPAQQAIINHRFRPS
jgi:hypothetical protein